MSWRGGGSGDVNGMRTVDAPTAEALQLTFLLLFRAPAPPSDVLGRPGNVPVQRVLKHLVIRQRHLEIGLSKGEFGLEVRLGAVGFFEEGGLRKDE